MNAAIARLGIDGGTRALAWLLAAIAPGFILMNPAVALLGGAAYALYHDNNPIVGSSRYAKLALQCAIVLLGLSINAGAIIELGQAFTGTVVLYVVATLAAGALLLRLFNIEPVVGVMLILGTAICGGTAIAAAAPFLNAKAPQLGVALAAVFLLNMVALLVFPHLGEWLAMTGLEFGAWVALAVHDTSSVVATAAVFDQAIVDQSASHSAVATATTIKLERTLFLIPAITFLACWQQGERGSSLLRYVKVPMFVLLFLAAAILGTFVSIPAIIGDLAQVACKVLLVVALFLVGLEMNRGCIRKLNGKVGVFAIVLWLVMAPVAYGLVHFALA